MRFNCRFSNRFSRFNDWFSRFNDRFSRFNDRFCGRVGVSGVASSFGFGFSDSSAMPPAILSVEIVDADSVRVTLASTPTGGNQRLLYAMSGNVGAPAGPTTGARGNLRDSDTTASPNGYPLYNWCVHFDEPVQ